MTFSQNIEFSSTSLAGQLPGPLPGPHLWLLDFSQLDTLAVECYQHLLSEDELARAKRYRRGQREFIACRAFMRLCLARYTGGDARTLCFAKSNSGKPYLLGDDARWQFNLSHTSRYAALAIAKDTLVGVDIEQPRRRNFLGIAADYFHPDELAFLQALPDAHMPEAFFQLWTLKEAFFKALGGGIATGLHLARFYWENTGEKNLLRHCFSPSLGENESEWHFYQTPPLQPQQLHLALAYRSAAASVYWFKGADLFADLTRI